MARPHTIDASVFLNAFNPAEAGHVESNRLLMLLQAQATPLIVPTLVLPEVAATISRVRNAASLARSFATQLERLPNLMLIALDTTLARQATEAAAQHRLRGSDAVYAAVALRFGSILVTLDREQHDRLARVLTSYTPGEALTELDKS
ncbi:MAG TPA: type II toxin-antitoxin system VapC family toxin [Anaerolineae bacterium]|nr:type II toxin-antitoxin system VapC family toxin [Anaerolineae bacterium]